MNSSRNLCLIDGNCRSKRSVIGRIARDLDLPAHFGHNLDALYDSLTTDVKGPIEIMWRRVDSARKRLGPDFTAIVDVLQQVARERADFTLELQE